MPTYVYRCAKCGEEIEAFQTFADAPLTKHKGCGGKLAKVLSAAGIVLKGSGFYKTDNRSSSKGAVQGLEGAPARRAPARGSGSESSGSSDSGSSSSDSGSGSSSSSELGLVVEAPSSSSRARRVSSGSAGQERVDRRARRRMHAEIGVFGGSGFYTLRRRRTLEEVERRHAVRRAERSRSRSATSADAAVAFIPRHGRDHEYAPAAVPARANLWALRTLGVRQVIGPCAAGSLRPTIHPGDFVVLDQLVDRTWGRPDTFYDAGDAHHVSFADPYCPVVAAARGRRRANASAYAMHDAGTVVVIPGPRFSTRAESRWYRAQGWHVVNMTQYPEAYLARELGMHYAGIALVTDYDTGRRARRRRRRRSRRSRCSRSSREPAPHARAAARPHPAAAGEPTGCGCASAVGPLGARRNRA